MLIQLNFKCFVLYTCCTFVLLHYLCYHICFVGSIFGTLISSNINRLLLAVVMNRDVE